MARSQVYQFDSAAIYKKTIFDFINDIRPCGGVTETAPFMGIKTNGVGGETGPLGWQLVLPYLIAIHYRHYGNVNLLAESLPFLEKQILSLEMRDFDDLVTCCLGDWGSRVHDMRNYKNGSPALHFTSACFYYYHLLIIAKICDDLGFKEKWLKYIGKANKIREKILSLYKNTDGSFADRSQTSFVFAIYFDLCDDIESSLNALIDLIKKEQNVITCGIFGQSFAYEIFHRYGHNELILEWLRVEAGFKKMLKNDASTLKEFFGDNLNGSNNHAMFSSYSSWLFQALGGITVAEEAVGADVILISPSFTDTINFVDCWHQTIRGRIECRWRRYKKGIELVIKVPFNLKKCTLKLPKVYQLNKQLPAPIDCDTYPAINGRKKHGEHIHFKVGEIDAIQNIMHVIISEIYSNNHLKEIRVNFLVGLLMTELLSNVQASDYHINGSYNESLAMAVLRYIDTDYKTASLKEISCRLNQPNYKVSKLIKDFTGKNFSDLLVEKRLDVLIHLLKHTNHSIIDVINMTGYENASHCYKVFKEKYNMSIKEYRDLNS